MSAFKATRALCPPRRIFSGIQPTGVPHLGNYLGALRPWVQLQKDAAPDDALTFCIVDLHALTARPDAAALRSDKRKMLAAFLAIGLDPARSTLYHQSAVPQHAQLMWLLACHASVGYLGRMTQWKSKLDASSSTPLDAAAAPTSHERLKLGLFAYPVLQAADVLLHATTHVPVGEDQRQHIEFARELAASFNHACARDSQPPPLVLPEAMVSPAKRVRSLADPARKMSKSDPKAASRVLLSDAPAVIAAKIRAARTDSLEGVSWEPERRPEVANLVALVAHFDEGGRSCEEVAADCKGLGLPAFKGLVTEVLVRYLEPIRERYEELVGREQELDDIAQEGAARASAAAAVTFGRVQRAVGLS